MGMVEDRVIIDCRANLVVLADISFEAMKNPLNEERLEGVKKCINKVMKKYHRYVIKDIEKIFEEMNPIFKLIKEENYQRVYDDSMKLLGSCPYPSFCN